MRKTAGVLFAILIAFGALFLKRDRTADFGVFLSAEKVSPAWRNYRTIVLDAQYFSKEELSGLKAHGVEVYSYLNIGSLERFRPYYAEYEHLTTGAYEHWEEERWVNITRPEWQEFIMERLAREMSDKGVDGFFVDNCDVYGEDSSEEVYSALVDILRALRRDGKKLIINGGDVFLRKYLERQEPLFVILTGVNQETVFTSIDFETGTFGRQTDDAREYYLKHLERCQKMGAEIFLTEYTTDRTLRREAEKFCRKNFYRLYISDSIELD